MFGCTILVSRDFNKDEEAAVEFIDTLGEQASYRIFLAGEMNPRELDRGEFLNLLQGDFPDPSRPPRPLDDPGGDVQSASDLMADERLA